MLLTAGFAFPQNPAQEKFFGNSPTDKDVRLPADRVYPRGRLFPFSFYSTGGGSERKRGELLPDQEYERDVKEIVNAGVSLIGPQYELQKRLIADAGKYHLQCFYTVYGLYDGKPISRAVLNSGKPLDAEKLIRETAPLVRDLSKHREIAFWDIEPNELRFWKKNDVLYLKTMAGIIRENDPLKRPIFIYEPCHRRAGDLARFLPYQDISGKGMYTNFSGFRKQRIWVRYSMEQELTAIKQQKDQRKIIPFAMPEMFQDGPEEELPLIESRVRHDVYCALANGAKGILVFSATRRPKFKSRRKYLDAYLRICRELRDRSDLSQALLFGRVTADLEVAVTEGPETIPLKIGKKILTYPSLSIAQFAWNNARYLLLVNSADKPVKAMIDNLVYGSNVAVQNILSQNGGNPFIVPEGNFACELKPYEAVCYKIFLRK